MHSLPYLLYRHTTAIKFWLFRRILPSGRGALIASAVSATMLMGSPITPLYQLFALVLGLCSVALVWCWFRKARLQATRLLPSQSTVGVPLRYELLITNHGRTLRHWSMEETLPDPRPSADHFSHSSEPAELRRNRFDRALGFHRWQWLMAQNRLFSGGKSQLQEKLAHGDTTRLTLTLVPQKRGKLPLNDLRVLLPDPFRFFQRACRIQANHDSIIVLPRRYPLPHLSLSTLSHRNQQGEVHSSQKKGQHGEFAALREYRRGDPTRRIHQKSWAKIGRPVIIEVEELSLPRYALALDTFAFEAAADFEVAVSLAASLLSDHHALDSTIEHVFFGHLPVVSITSSCAQSSQKWLEALAQVTLSPKENFAKLLDDITRHAVDVAGVVVIFTGWSDSRAQFLQQLEARDVNVLGLSIGHDQDPLPRNVHRIRPSKVIQDLQSFALSSAQP